MAKDQVLSLGWLRGEERIKDGIALAEIGMGKGRIVLFAFRPSIAAKPGARSHSSGTRLIPGTSPDPVPYRCLEYQLQLGFFVDKTRLKSVL